MKITFTLNEEKLTLDASPETKLLDLLRKQNLISVKRGCNKADGGCELMNAECIFAKRLRIADSRIDYSSLEEGAVPPVESRP